MRNKLMIICVLNFAAINFCCSGANHDTYQGEPMYKVYKIDSINNYYTIYISKNDSSYKIISKRELTDSCNRIKEGNYYDFELSSLSIGEIMTPGFANCLWVDSVTKICMEDSIRDLKSANNVKGLCYTGEQVEKSSLLETDNTSVVYQISTFG
jgi:hypothetical protein